MNNEPVAWGKYYPEQDMWALASEKTPPLPSEGFIPLYTHPAKTKELLDEIEDLKLQNKYLKGCKHNIEIVAENEALKAKVKWYDDTFRLPTETHPAKTLTDEEIMEIFTAYEQMQEYGYVGKKPFEVHTGWNLSERNDCLMLARAILRKAQ